MWSVQLRTTESHIPEPHVDGALSSLLKVAPRSNYEFVPGLSPAVPIGPQFAASVSEFLDLCDQRKFAPSPNSQPFGGVEQALNLLDLGEGRRAELRRAEQPTEAHKR